MRKRISAASRLGFDVDVARRASRKACWSMNSDGVDDVLIARLDLTLALHPDELLEIAEIEPGLEVEGRLAGLNVAARRLGQRADDVGLGGHDEIDLSAGDAPEGVDALDVVGVGTGDAKVAVVDRQRNHAVSPGEGARDLLFDQLRIEPKRIDTKHREGRRPRPGPGPRPLSSRSFLGSRLAREVHASDHPHRRAILLRRRLRREAAVRRASRTNSEACSLVISPCRSRICDRSSTLRVDMMRGGRERPGGTGILAEGAGPACPSELVRSAARERAAGKGVSMSRVKKILPSLLLATLAAAQLSSQPPRISTTLQLKPGFRIEIWAEASRTPARSLVRPKARSMWAAARQGRSRRPRHRRRRQRR